MAFRFNFSGSTKDDIVNSTCLEKSLIIQKQQSWVPCKFINITDINAKVQSNEKLNTMKCGNWNIKYIKQSAIGSIAGNLSVIEETKSDLLPGKYEGGLKVWECAVDLAQFLAENNCIQGNDSALELGCGVGLPGITAYLCGASVTFQDFNSEVLELATAPNVFLNTPEELHTTVSERCQFLCGDWKCIKEKYFSDGLVSRKYDCIITSETIYEKCNHRKLLDLLKSALKPGGVIYLASKVHYFGVGGGILDFEELLKEDDTFEFSTVFRTDDGVERRILKLTFKDSVKSVI